MVQQAVQSAGPGTTGQLVLVEKRSSGIALVTLNRPESLNALSAELMAELGQQLAEIDRDPSVSCMVMTGAGRGFCSGGDIKGMSTRDASAGEAARAYEPGTELEQWENHSNQARRMHADIPGRIYEFSKPTISLVNGPAAGAGVGLALCHDITIASDRASFTTAFARIGRSGDFGTSYFLHWRVGPSKARELYFTSERIDAVRALALGMVSYIYPHDELLQRGLELAEKIAGGPVRAFARMKRAMRAADAGDVQAVLEIESMNMPLSGRSREGQRFLKQFMSRSR
jgi:2-(1,2-epoxy-1,2-dihydrophenyl)acetyl-CoA isomerase